mmetsp:Transcript_8662/g.13326  ORF Transcript_8662/g.13326 Transcript_8662/m.13326 type:complete len:207 (-) Transcript_8662:195-815(-)
MICTQASWSASMLAVTDLSVGTPMITAGGALQSAVLRPSTLPSKTSGSSCEGSSLENFEVIRFSMFLIPSSSWRLSEFLRGNRLAKFGLTVPYFMASGGSPYSVRVENTSSSSGLSCMETTGLPLMARPPPSSSGPRWKASGHSRARMHRACTPMATRRPWVTGSPKRVRGLLVLVVVLVLPSPVSPVVVSSAPSSVASRVSSPME